MLYENQGLKNNTFKIDVQKLRKGGALAQVFAFFINITERKEPTLEFETMYDNFKQELDKNKTDVELVTNLKELINVEKLGKIGAFIAIEEGEVLGGRVENLQMVYDKGIRFITLTWNHKNTLGYPNYQYFYKDNGLTPLGIEMVEEMERLGIVPDASHLSDKGFYDLVRICKNPFIVTHSNSREVTNHPRNLTDDMIKLLSNKGGVMGINFCAKFIGKNKVTSIEDIIKHIKHIKNVGGIDVLSLGSDFDGIENEVEIEDTSKMGDLYHYLAKAGFTDYEVEKIFYKNSLRIFKENLK